MFLARITPLRVVTRGFSTSIVARMTTDYQNIQVSLPEPGVALIRLNRPKALNALSNAMFADINAALAELAADKSVGAVVFTGSGKKAFAAGADIKEMKDQTFDDVYGGDMLSRWTKLYEFRKPTLAAVNGYALGGGCELSMMCDIVYASPTATFGLPEITLGVIPGAGGTQRLTRAIGKSRAMELILTGKTFSAQEAEQWGLVSKVVGDGEDEVVTEAVKTAALIANKGRLAVLAAKESVKAADELSLSQGIQLEKRIFHSLFATPDQKEGMTAFVEKRKPRWAHL